MMETIRTAANHIVVKIIFAIIILCFIFTGIGFLGFGGGNSAQDEQMYIAKVNGEGISRAQFEAQARQLTSKAGGDISFIKQMRRDVFNYQVDNYLAYKFAQDLKSMISNDHVKNFIRSEKQFFENGQFNNQKYLDLLAENGYTPDDYAESIRKVLQQKQVIDALISTNFVLPVDSEIASLKDQTRQIYATSINPSTVNLDDVKITEEDEQKYYEEHKSEFYRRERVKFRYILNSKDNIAKNITVSDDEIKKEFSKHIKKYTFPAKMAYSVIYVLNKEQADKIAKDLSSGIDFNSIANTVNQNNEISPYGKNGSLGWFSVDDSLPQVFKDANLKNVGQISKPISIDNGYVFVKLDDMQKAKTMDFDYAKDQIGLNLENQKIQRTFEQIEDRIKAALNNSSKSLEEIAKKTDLTIYDNDWAYYNDVASILRYPEVRDVAFSEEMVEDGKVTGKISDIIPVGSNRNMYDFVIQVVDYRPEGIAPFDEVKEQINTKLYNDLANSRFESAVNDLLTKLNESGNSSNISFVNQYTLSRNSDSLDKQVVDMVYNLIPSATSKRVYGAQFLDDKKIAYIAVLTKVDTPNEKKDLSSQLRPLIMSDTYNYLSSDIRSKAKIEIMPNSNL